MPSPLPSGGDKESKAIQVDGHKSKEKEHNDPKSLNDSKVNPKSDDSEKPSTKKEVVGEKSPEEQNEGKTDSHSGGNENCHGNFASHSGGKETCDGSTNRCSIRETLTGCIQRLETGNFIALLLFCLYAFFIFY